VRADLLACLVLCAGCSAGHESGPYRTVVSQVALDGHALTLETYWETLLSRERGYDYRIDLATGACKLLSERPRYPEPPLSATTPLHDQPVRISSAATARRLELAGEIYLELAGPSGKRHVLLPPGTQVAWVDGTPLVLLDGKRLFSPDSGRMLEVDRHRGIGYALRGDRLYMAGADGLVAYNLRLEVIERRSPRLALYQYESPGSSSDHVLLDRPGNDVGWTASRDTVIALPGFRSVTATLTPARWEAPPGLGASWREVAPRRFARQAGTHLLVEDRGERAAKLIAKLELAGRARWLPGTPLIFGDDWVLDLRAREAIARPPGPITVSVGLSSQYLRTETGEIYFAAGGWLARVPTVGTLLLADDRGFVLASPDDSVIWHVSPDGTWRAYHAHC